MAGGMMSPPPNVMIDAGPHIQALMPTVIRDRTDRFLTSRLLAPLIQLHKFAAGDIYISFHESDLFGWGIEPET